MNGSSSDPLYHCSLCGRHQHEVDLILAGDSLNICDECVDICTEIVSEHREKKKEITHEA